MSGRRRLQTLPYRGSHTKGRGINGKVPLPFKTLITPFHGHGSPTPRERHSCHKWYNRTLSKHILNHSEGSMALVLTTMYELNG